MTRITVDGNDVVAVYRVAYESLERVRLGGGPVLIEGRTWQLAGKRLRRAEKATPLSTWSSIWGPGDSSLSVGEISWYASSREK